MALLGGKRLHLVISDSRVIGIGDVVKRKGNQNELIEFRMCKIASFGERVDVAMSHLGKCPFDIVYVAGGVCDLTTKKHTTRAISFEWESEDSFQITLNRGTG